MKEVIEVKRDEFAGTLSGINQLPGNFKRTGSERNAQGFRGRYIQTQRHHGACKDL